MTDRLSAISAQEFEAHVKHLVERKFEIAWQRGARKAPITGDEIYYDAPPEHRAQLIRRATKALIARKHFAECEAPPWALALGPLPLSQDEIVSLLNDHDRGDYRPRMLAGYGQALRSMGWELKHAPPFESFFPSG